MNRIGGGPRITQDDFHKRMESIKNAPLFFVPTVMLCHCGQRVMTAEENHTPPDLYVVVMCTNPLCTEHNREKKIPLPEFRNYRYVE